MDVPKLVSCEWLNERLGSGNLGNIVILDVSWSSTKDCKEEYNKQHIPGARYVDVMSGKHDEMFPRNLPTADTFTEQAQKAGINTDSHVVVYSNSDRAGYFMAGRGWWTFRRMDIPKLVSCDWLNERLGSGNLGNIVILDVSWSSTKDCKEEYNKQHIQGARYVDVMSGKHDEMFPRNLPTADTFTEQAQKAGINTDSHVVVYSNSDRAGYFMAGRGWWTFRVFGHNNVSILDGGLSKWLQLGYPTTDSCTDIQPGNFVPSSDKCMYKSFDEVKDNTATNKFQVIDTRADTAFTENHIPGAKNIFMTDLIDNEKGTLKSEDQLKELLNTAGIDLTQPVVTHCNSGMSSCTVAFAVELLGGAEASVFHGGFTEWKKKQSNQ